MYENWEFDADQKEADYLDGWEALQEALAEDEAFAREMYEAFHGSEV